MVFVSKRYVVHAKMEEIRVAPATLPQRLLGPEEDIFVQSQPKKQSAPF